MSKADRRNISKGAGDLWDTTLGKDGLAGWLGNTLGIRDDVSGWFDKNIPWHRQIKPSDWQMMALSLFGPGAISALGSGMFTGGLGMMGSGLSNIGNVANMGKNMSFLQNLGTAAKAVGGIGQLGLGAASAGAGAGVWGMSALPSVIQLSLIHISEPTRPY